MMWRWIPALPSIVCIPCKSSFPTGLCRGQGSDIELERHRFCSVTQTCSQYCYQQKIHPEGGSSSHPHVARAVIQGAARHCAQMGNKCTAQHIRRKNTKSPMLLPCSAPEPGGVIGAPHNTSALNTLFLFLTFPSEDFCPCSCPARPEGSKAGGHWFYRMRWSFPAFYSSKLNKGPKNNNGTRSALCSLREQWPNWGHF